MAQVPYNPVPSIKPTDANVQEANVRAPAEAFGVGLGRAYEGLGKQLERSGDEIFNTALQLRKYELDTEAVNASIAFSDNTAKARSEFLAAEGTQAGPAALDKYMGSLKEERERLRGTLSAPYSQRAYDRETRVDMSRAFTAGAVHSAQQTRKAMSDSLQAKETSLKADQDSAPDDEEAWDLGAHRLVDNIRRQGQLHGWAPGVAEDKARAVLEEQRAKQVVAVGNLDPVKGRALAEKYKGELGAHTNEVHQALQRDEADMLARNVAAEETKDTYSTDFDPSTAEPLAPRVARARERVEALTHGENPKAVEQVTRETEAMYNRAMTGFRNQQMIYRESLGSVVMGEGLDHKPTSKDDLFRAKPESKEWYDKSSAATKAAVDKRLVKNSEGDYTWNDKRKARYEVVRGIFSDPSQKVKALEIELLKEEFPWATTKRLIDQQATIRVHPDQDPRVSRTMTNLSPQIQSIGGLKEQSESRYYRIRGILQGMIEDWQHDEGKLPSAKEEREIIWPNVVKKISSPGFFYGTNKTPLYDYSPTNAEIEAERTRLEKLGIPADDATIYQNIRVMHGTKTRAVE